MKKSTLVLIFIVILGFLLRAVGINFGLPFVYHNDEPIIVNYAMAYGTGDLNPHFFKVPPFLSYLLFFLYGLYYLIGKLMGLFKNAADFGYLFLSNPTNFYLIGRMAAGVFFGTASILLIYLFVKRIFFEKTALLAALFLSLNFLHVRDSHYIYYDIPSVFFTLLFFIALYSLYEKNHFRNYIFCGLTLGLVTSMKYNGILLGLPMALILVRNAVVCKEGALVQFKKNAILILSFAAALFVTNPFMFLDYKFFFNAISRMPFHKVDFWYHLKVSLLGGCGLLMCIASICGMFLALIQRRFFPAALVIFSVFYYFILTMSSQEAERYIFPVLPIVILFAAHFVSTLLKMTRPRAANAIIGISMSLFLLGPSLVKVYYCDKLFLAEDTRTQSYRWIKENIPANTKIALDATGPIYPVLEQDREFIRESFKRFDNPKFDTPRGALKFKVRLILENPDYPKKTYRIYYLKRKPSRKRFLGTYPEILFDLVELKRKGIEYVIANRLVVDSAEDTFLPELEKTAVLVKEFTPYKDGVERIRPLERSGVPAAAFTYTELKDRERFGPVIRIYRII